MDNTRLKFAGLRTSIFVDGAPLAHHDVQFDANASQGTSWIASEPDKCFSIKFKLTNRKPGETYLVQAFLDGYKAGSAVMLPGDSSSARLSATRISLTEMRKFMFGRIELTDDDALLESSAHALGDIKIVLEKAGKVVPSVGKPNTSIRSVPEAQKVHERAKKGLVHGVKYAEAERITDRNRPRYKTSNHTLIATHLIRYRPLAWLQANGIVPYVPADHPMPASSSQTAAGSASRKSDKKRKAPADEDEQSAILPDDNEGENLRRQESELLEQLAVVRQKQAERQEGPSAKRIKTEDMKPILRGEVIDLTI